MIKRSFVQLMAQYNRWQNQSLVAAADGLTDAARREDRGAFFRSIHGTFCHLLWGDEVWMHRFAGTPKPEIGSIAESADLCASWEDFRHRRNRIDAAILSWASALKLVELKGDLRWFSGAAGREVKRPMALLVSHFFNHQTHHRGQLHAMLTSAGARPDDTDLFLTPGFEA